jgi:hypothetical protein
VVSPQSASIASTGIEGLAFASGATDGTMPKLSMWHCSTIVLSSEGGTDAGWAAGGTDGGRIPAGTSSGGGTVSVGTSISSLIRYSSAAWTRVRGRKRNGTRPPWASPSRSPMTETRREYSGASKWKRNSFGPTGTRSTGRRVVP